MSKLTDFVETLDLPTLLQIMGEADALEGAASEGGSFQFKDALFMASVIKAHPDIFRADFVANDVLNLVLAVQRRLSHMWVDEHKQARDV